MSTTPQSAIQTKPAIKSELHSFLKIAFPLSITFTSQVLLVITDMIVVGKLGTQALSVLSLANPIFLAVLLLGIGTVWAVTTLIAQAYGAKLHSKVRIVTQNALWLSLFMSVVCAAVSVLVSFLLFFTKQDPNTAKQAAIYLYIITLSTPFILSIVCMRAFMSALNNTKPAMIIILLTLPLNLALDVLLVFPPPYLSILHNLNLYGAALSTLLINVCMCASMFLIINTKPPYKKYRIYLGISKLQPDVFYHELRFGIPVGLSYVVERVPILITTFLMGASSIYLLSAYQVTISTANVIFMFTLGFVTSGTSRVGQAIGAQSKPRLIHATIICLSSVLVISVLFAILVNLFDYSIVSWYINPLSTQDKPAFILAMQYIPFASFYIVFSCLNNSISGCLYGTGDNKFPLFINIAVSWLVMIPLCSLLYFLIPTYLAVWISLIASSSLSCILLSARLLHYFIKKPTLKTVV